jgi:hypothetical protein
MAASLMLHIALTRRCDVLNDAALTLRNEAAGVLRCLRESLQEPAFACALALLVCRIGQDEERETAKRNAPWRGCCKRQGLRCLRHAQPRTARAIVIAGDF